MKKFDVCIAFLVAFFWGSNFTAVKLSIIEIPGLLALSLRFLLTAIILLPFITKPKISFAKLYLVSLVFGIFYIGLLYYGMHLGLNTSLTIILIQLNIPFSIIIARIFLKESLTLKTILGVAIAFLGMAVVAGTPHLIGNNVAVFILLLSAFFYAIFNIQSRKLKEIPPSSLLCWTSLISMPHLFMISYFIDGNPIDLMQNLSHIGWASIIYSAAISGALGITLWIYLLQKYPISQVMPFNLLVPFFGISISILLLDEIPSWHIIVGGLITLGGIAVTQVKRLQ